jgi:hypothetical protein
MVIVTTDRESPEEAPTDRTAEEVPEGRLCPFCGWDRVQYAPECPHLVTDLTEWPENFSGDHGGTFGKVEVRALGPLYRAVRDFLRSGKGSTPAGLPDRLRTLIQAVARNDEDSDEEDTELDTEVEGFGPEWSPHKDASRRRPGRLPDRRETGPDYLLRLRGRVRDLSDGPVVPRRRTDGREDGHPDRPGRGPTPEGTRPDNRPSPVGSGEGTMGG